jgi:transcriptional regulator with XRE-family HTH domain
MKIFAKRLKLIRESEGVTQKQLADHLGVTIRTIVNYENDSREPKFVQLVAIARYFNVGIDYLLGLHDDD